MTVWVILAIYVVLMAATGFISFKKADTLTGFVVGSRSAGPWFSAFGFGTTYFSAVIFIGYAGRSGFDYGLFAILIGIGNAILGSWLAWKVLANRTREVTRRLKIKSMPQFFEKRYFSRNMKLYAAIIVFIFMTPYSASVYSGLSYLCESVLHVPYQIAMAAIAVVSGIYLVLGGYFATLLADFIQGIIMLVGVAAMLFFVSESGQVGGFASGVSQVWESMCAQSDVLFTPQTALSVICLILLTSVGSWGMPQMVHKFYGIKNEDGVKKGTVISTLFALIIAGGAYYIGSLSRIFFTEVPTLDGKANYDLIVPQILTQTLPVILLGVVLVLVVSASVSTLSGITLTSCSTISMDLVADRVSKFAEDKAKTLTLTRVLCAVFILVSYLIASFKTPILTLMSFSWGTISGAFLAPYMLGLYWKGMNRAGAWCGMITGPVVSLGLALLSGFNSAYATIFGVAAMAVSFLACWIGSLVAAKMGKVQDNSHFYDKAYFVK